MKNTFLPLIVIFFLFSCSKTSNDKMESVYDSDSFPQKWQLKKMSGQIPNSETEGLEMEWQETYTLNDDGTFTKSRERNNVISEVTGTFVFKELLDGTYLILNHQADNELIGSCLNPLEEVLYVMPNGNMRGTWSACDGPGLEYKRIN